MVFGFFKELIDSIKEGVAEAKSELAEEAQANLAAGQQLDEQARLLPAQERFWVALGAPYRETFVGDLGPAKAQNRAPYFLLAAALPEREKADITKLLERDFDIVDRASLRRASQQIELVLLLWCYPTGEANTLLEQLPPGSYGAHALPSTPGGDEALEQWLEFINRLEEALGGDGPALQQLISQLRTELPQRAATFPSAQLGLLALWMSRLSYFTSSSVALGYLPLAEAEHHLATAQQLAKGRINSWQQFGELFVQGDRLDGSNNVLGRKVLAGKVQNLLSDPISPWVTDPWLL